MPAARMAIAATMVLALACPASAATAPQSKETSCSASSKTSALAQGDVAFKAARHAEAAQHYTAAAKCGEAKAQSRLGIMLLSGQGVPKDEKAAAEWLSKASEQGDAVAQLGFATQLRHGLGITQDLAGAYKWFAAAADQGLAEAQFRVGSQLVGGHGVKIDQVEAARWFYRAALQGHPYAQSSLASIELGLFLSDKEDRRPIIRAYMWARLADKASCSTSLDRSAEATAAEPLRRVVCEFGQKVRNSASEFLTPNELSDAGKLADSWKRGATSIPAPPEDALSKLPLAVDMVRLNEATRQQVPPKSPRIRELAAVDRWMIGQTDSVGSRTLVATLIVPGGKKAKGVIRIVCPEQSEHGPFVVLSQGLFEIPPPTKALLDHFNGNQVMGVSAGGDVAVPLNLGVTLNRPEPAMAGKTRQKLTSDALAAGNGTFRFRLNDETQPEVVVRQQVPHSDPSAAGAMAAFQIKDFKPGSLQDALLKCRGFVKSSL